MKKYLAGAILGLACSVAMAAPLKAKSPLVGQWTTSSTEGGGAKGDAEFKADGTAILSPEGFKSARGTYSAKDGWLDIDMSKEGMGKATAHYTISEDGKTLNIAYPGGVRQTFKRK